METGFPRKRIARGDRRQREHLLVHVSTPAAVTLCFNQPVCLPEKSGIGLVARSVFREELGRDSVARSVGKKGSA